MLTVFLSSTFKDLEAHREAVLNALRIDEDVRVLAMENWTAEPTPPKALCMERVDEADVFVAVVGHLYGFVPDGDDQSVTVAEYERAVANQTPILAFVAKDDFPVPARLWRSDSDPAAQEDFRARVLGEQTVDLKWETPGELATRVTGAVGKFFRTRGVSRENVPSAVQLDVEQYVDRARKKWDKLDLTTVAEPGAVVEETERPDLTRLFIPQDCRRSRPPVSLPRDYLLAEGLDPIKEEAMLDDLRRRWEREERLPVLDLIGREEGSRLVILGDPGAGKSALAAYVLLRLLDAYGRDGISDWRRQLAGHLPFLIELRDWVAREADGKCGGLISYLGYLGEEVGFGFDEAAIEQHLDATPTVLLIDGLDEVFDPDTRKLVAEQIVGLTTRFPKARIVITSRIAGFDAHPFEAADFEVATLDDLSPTQVRAYAERWFALAFSGAPDKAEQKTAELIDTLERRPQLRALAGNPLLLTIMGIVARHRRLARSRAQLYRQALDVLCYAWDYGKGLKLPDDSPLRHFDPDDTFRLLRRVAWHMQGAGEGLRANAIREADLKDVLAEYLREEWGFDKREVRRATQEMIQRLSDRNWILTLRGPHLFGFVHRTFLEYLCAVELAERFRQQQLDASELAEGVASHIGDDSWREVARLLCGELPAAAEALIGAVLDLPGSMNGEGPGFPVAWQLVSEVPPQDLRRFASTADRLTDALYTALASDESFWVSFSDDGDPMKDVAESVSAIEKHSWPGCSPRERGWPTINPKGYLSEQSVAVVLLAARYLWGEAKGALPYGINLVDSGYPSALRGIGLALGDREDAFAYISDRSEGADPDVRRDAVSTLAESFSDRPGVFDLVRSRAEGDADANVRETAVYALAESFSGRPETFGLVQSRAESDADADVREAAVYALAESFSGRPETFGLVQSWAEGDADANVRETAVYALAESFSGHPETFGLIRSWAEGDADADVRRAAVHALARSFSDRPGVLGLVRSWAEGDADAGVRRAAVSALANSFSDRPGVFGLVRSRAEGDADADAGVRQGAVHALARSFSDRPGVFGLVRSWAEGDADADVRRAAVHALANSFGNRDETLEVLYARLQDQSEEVRRAAFFWWVRRAIPSLASPFFAIKAHYSYRGLDPASPVTEESMERVMSETGLTLAEVRTEYERLVDEHGAPLTLAWRSGES